MAASPTVTADAAEDFVRERAAFVATTVALGPDAPTLCGSWTGEDLAAHVVSGERLAGVVTYVGRRMVVRGVRLNDRAGAVTDAVLRANRRKGFDWLVNRLRRPPPMLLRRPSVAVMSLAEVWIHHEDLRRANGLGRRPDEPALVPCVDWALRYHRALLRDVGLRVTLDGEEGTRCAGPQHRSVTVGGPAGEVLLWLAGRREVAGVEVDGDSDGLASVHRLRI